MNHNNHSNHTIILAGVTGDLGGRVARFLLQQGATVRAIVRPGKTNNKGIAKTRLVAVGGRFYERSGIN